MLPSKDGVLAANTKKEAKKAKLQLFKERNAGSSEMGGSSSKVVQKISSLADVSEENLVKKCKRRPAKDEKARLRKLSMEIEIREGHLQTQQEKDIKDIDASRSFQPWHKETLMKNLKPHYQPFLLGKYL